MSLYSVYTCKHLDTTPYRSPVFGMLFIIMYQVRFVCMPELYGLIQCNYGHSLSMLKLCFAGHDTSGCRSFAKRSTASRQLDDLNDLVYAAEIVGHLTIFLVRRVTQLIVYLVLQYRPAPRHASRVVKNAYRDPPLKVFRP